MKTIFTLIVLALASVSCTTTSDYKQLSKELVKPGFNVIQDEPNNAICYIYKDDDVDALAMTCLKKDPFKNIKVQGNFSN